MRCRLTIAFLLMVIAAPASSGLAASLQRPTSSSSGIGIRLVGVADAYIVDRVTPATSIRRRIEITNNTATAADIAVYPAAAFLRRGTFGFASGHSRNELSGWTSVTRRVLRLPPGVRALETVTINVPKSATRGEHYAVIWAEVSAATPAGGGVTLRVNLRSCISVILNSGGRLLACSPLTLPL